MDELVDGRKYWWWYGKRMGVFSNREVVRLTKITIQRLKYDRYVHKYGSRIHLSIQVEKLTQSVDFHNVFIPTT